MSSRPFHEISLITSGVLTAVKGLFYIWTIYLHFASTFKPSGSLSSTLMKTKKRETTKVEKVKVILQKPQHIPQSRLPSPRPNCPLSLSLSYQLPVYASLSKSSGSQIKCWTQNWLCSTPGLLEEKRKNEHMRRSYTLRSAPSSLGLSFFLVSS